MANVLGPFGHCNDGPDRLEGIGISVPYHKRTIRDRREAAPLRRTLMNLGALCKRDGEK